MLPYLDGRQLNRSSLCRMPCLSVGCTERAARLFPLLRAAGEHQPALIVIDPERAFGRPSLARTGIPVEAIQERFKGGDSAAALASDFGVGVEAIEEALRAA